MKYGEPKAAAGGAASRSAEQAEGTSSRSAELRGMSFAEASQALSPVQMKSEGGSPDAPGVQAIAASGVQGAGSALPHLDTIQRSFGAHDVSNVRAHVGGAAADAASAIGASAYATDNNVAFDNAPSLHTAAHEAAHVVQQRQGVQLKGGVGSSGDVYEQHADAVADAVVSGKSAEGLLDQNPGGGGGHDAVQLEEAPKAAAAAPDEATRLAKAAKGAIEGNPTYHWDPPWDQGEVGDTPDLVPRKLVFDDKNVQALLDHLSAKWGCEHKMRVDPFFDMDPVPGWVAEFRVHVGYIRGRDDKAEKEFGDTVEKLCNAVAKPSEAEEFRARLVQTVLKHSGPGGKAVVPQAELDNYSANFTSCTSFMPRMLTGASKKGGPQVGKGFGGPNAYSEICPTGEKTLTTAWTGYWGKAVVNKGDESAVTSDRPAAGDMVIFKKYGQGEAQHISFFASLTKRPDGKEEWKCVGGGKEPLGADGKRKEAPAMDEHGVFDPATGLLGSDAANGGRVVLGYIDVATLHDNLK